MTHLRVAMAATCTNPSPHGLTALGPQRIASMRVTTQALRSTRSYTVTMPTSDPPTGTYLKLLSSNAANGQVQSSTSATAKDHRNDLYRVNRVSKLPPTRLQKRSRMMTDKLLRDVNLHCR